MDHKRRGGNMNKESKVIIVLGEFENEAEGIILECRI